MSTHPVMLVVPRVEKQDRIHVAFRVLFLLLVGACGLSLGGAFMLLFLALPVFAAAQSSARGGAAYLRDEAPRVVKLLRWLVAAYAYLLMLTDRPPDERYADNVSFRVTPGGSPTASSAMWRYLSSLPALLLMLVIGIPSGLLAFISMVLILLQEPVPAWVRRYQVGFIRYVAGLLAFHASVEDAYPVLEFESADHDHPATLHPV